MFYKSVIRPMLFRKDPEASHEMILRALARLEFLYDTVEEFYRCVDDRLVVKIGPLTFSNPVGLAGGFDKNVTAPKMISAFGFGFMEVGAITAQAQPGNPKPRLYRLPEDDALINRLGFNNEGAAAIAIKLDRLRARGGRPKIPLGMNIGRTKIVETKDAVADFLSCFADLFAHGDFFTLNVSSPNTPNLRDLQEKSLLRELLAAVQEKNRELSTRANVNLKPVFVKIAPDMEFAQVDEIVDVVEQVNLSGIVATNATALSVSDVDAVWSYRDPEAPGNNYMIFDNYRLGIDTSSKPAVQAVSSLNRQFRLRVFGDLDFRYAAREGPADVPLLLRRRRQGRGRG